MATNASAIATMTLLSAAGRSLQRDPRAGTEIRMKRTLLVLGHRHCSPH
jgi:hypothetical protein